MVALHFIPGIFILRFFHTQVFHTQLFISKFFIPQTSSQLIHSLQFQKNLKKNSCDQIIQLSHIIFLTMMEELQNRTRWLLMQRSSNEVLSFYCKITQTHPALHPANLKRFAETRTSNLAHFCLINPSNDLTITYIDK